MAAVTQGNENAFQRLLHLHVDTINRFARRMIANSHEADDITQEAMLRLWQQAGKFDPQRSKLTTWLHRITRNLCIDHLRRNARFTRLDDSDNPITAISTSNAQTPSPETELESLDIKNRVQSALFDLPERQRSALVLSYYQQLSNMAVAEILDTSLSATESLLARARRNLKTKLEETHEQ
ncbi:MAG: sigma-70 family RNA polymerase sigma factor [Gammaproteobacteria bacterium]|nr:sigma-70 family RNA polymerase sigma factor [Gammaproteobacteria bacterium]MBT5204803.1 sigma-70 family RNA polymerase sigma factor [Gammaproteobacteria bacterium]MBT5603928.1 sigma-70 family RNA polymerase sigma factor [Gammaproteobacteria bacterium]MBT6245711.1 sigma-70 family RNA polymerase sigma factor [Gammaproteobacteria bacterium]